MSALSSHDIEHLGRLARLDLTEEEKSRFAGQLSSVVAYIEQLSEVDTSQIGQLRGVTGRTNVLANDDARSENDLTSVDRAKLLEGGPVHDDKYFVVRAVMGEEISAS